MDEMVAVAGGGVPAGEGMGRQVNGTTGSTTGQSGPRSDADRMVGQVRDSATEVVGLPSLRPAPRRLIVGISGATGIAYGIRCFASRVRRASRPTS